MPRSKKLSVHASSMAVDDHDMKQFKEFTAKQFAALPPFDRGYLTYMCGCRKDQPNIPDERNPYPKNSEDAKNWVKGRRAACINTMDIGA